jgi:hypothetical protein
MKCIVMDDPFPSDKKILKMGNRRRLRTERENVKDKVCDIFKKKKKTRIHSSAVT